jgi:type II secretory ATPase GspE/PulE/Tfp pilus assembly ATPase PilB-like protein
MSTDAPAAREPRFFSEGIMLEMARELEARGLLTRGQIDDLNARRAFTGESLDRAILKDDLVAETTLLEILSSLTHLPFAHMADLRIDPDAVRKVQARIALRYNVMPVALRGGVITLAVSQVPSMTMVDSVRMLLDLAVEWMLCTEADISKSLKYFYGLGAETIDVLVDGAAGAAPADDLDISDESADAGMVKFVNQIISEAIRMGATDVHIEPYENRLRLRYRIDGLLQEIPVPEGVAQLSRAVASCVKIMADMNIAERRKPHDGRIKVRCGSDEFDLRVSVLPTRHGETVNLRILSRKSMFIDMDHLGLNAAQQPAIEYLSALPHGVILLTGPTGSGKTTTLYALLSRLNKAEVKIITVEDPVEYQMEGINQIQVHAQIGLTFSAALRSILRHDPDIILIGEMRDQETADIAVRASLTGHLVFSTLHTNDAPSAVTRLLDMGVEPYLVSSCLEGVIAQRLVRRICSACREPMTPDDTIIEEITGLMPDRVRGAAFLAGRGCPDCNFTGYRGRLALFEIMMLNDELRTLIVHQRPSNEVRAAAARAGLVTLREDGWNKVLDGVTTVEEVVRVARRLERHIAV